MPCYMHVSAFRCGLLLKKLKYFEVMIRSFEFSRVWENVESWFVYAISFFEFPNHIYRLT